MPRTIARDQVITGNDDSTYVLIDRLGNGSFGEVWKAHRSSDGSDVALKFIPKQSFEEAGLKDVTVYDNPHVMRIYDRLFDDDYCILVMELADKSLESAA